MQIYTIFSRLGNKLTNLFNLLLISSTITQKNKANVHRKKIFFVSQRTINPITVLALIKETQFKNALFTFSARNALFRKLSITFVEV